MCTPSKTGTLSAIGRFCNHPVWAIKIKPLHEPKSPMDGDPHRRILTVRHPLDRWTSMYYYLLRDSCWLHKYARVSIDALAEEWLRQKDEELGPRGYFMWTWNLSRYVNVFQPTDVFDVTLDNGDSLIELISKLNGVELRKLPHAHRSKHRVGWLETLAPLRERRPDLVARLVAWALPDIRGIREVNGSPIRYEEPPEEWVLDAEQLGDVQW